MTDDYEKLKYKRAKKWISDLQDLSKYDLDVVFLSILEENETETTKKVKKRNDTKV